MWLADVSTGCAWRAPADTDGNSLGAEMRPALQDLARYPDVRLAGVAAGVFTPATRLSGTQQVFAASAHGLDNYPVVHGGVMRMPIAYAAWRQGVQLREWDVAARCGLAARFRMG